MITKEQAKLLTNLVNEIQISDFFETLRQWGIKDAKIKNLENEYLAGHTRHDFNDRLQTYVNSLVETDLKCSTLQHQFYEEPSKHNLIKLLCESMDEAFRIMEKIINLNNETADSVVNHLLDLKGRYNRISTDYNDSLLTTEQFNVERNKISKSLQRIINHFPDLYFEELLIEKKIESAKIDETQSFSYQNNSTNDFSQLVAVFMLLLIFAVFLTVQCESKVNKFDFSNENDNHESIGSASKFCKIIQSNGRDKNGKKVSIIAYKIGNFYSWDANSIEYISFNGTGKREKLSDYLSSNAKNLSFGDNISELIVLGTSCYPKSKPQQEEQTAEQRAEHLAQLLDEFRITDKPIYISNIGRCKFPKKLSKAVKEAQGSLIIIAVKAKDSNTNMEEAIFNALESANGMPFNINFFSLVKEKRIPIECLLNCK